MRACPVMGDRSGHVRRGDINWGEPEQAPHNHVYEYCRGWTTTTTDADVLSTCNDVNQDQQYGRGSTSATYEWAGLYCTLCAQ